MTPALTLDKLNALQKYQGLTKQSATPYNMTTTAIPASVLGYNPLDFEGNALSLEMSNAISDGNFTKVRQRSKNSAADYVANNQLTAIDKPVLDAVPSQGSGGLLPGSNRQHDSSMDTYNMLKYGTAEDQDAYFKGLDIEDKATDWGMQGYGGVALGAGQLGLGVMSYLENSRTADKQRAVMDQQIASNKFALGSANDFKAALEKNFNKGS
jgi:hypothetical protein